MFEVEAVSDVEEIVSEDAETEEVLVVGAVTLPCELLMIKPDLETKLKRHYR